jgi:23S rRNA (cytosine1962-C5)-methyltransferase
MTEERFADERRRKLVLRRGKERVIANRHPWIFAGAIGRESGPVDAAIADLVDDSGTRIASGLYSAHSQIRLRALTFGDEELTADTIRDRIRAAFARRANILTESTTAARLIHAEGDELSGLVVDRYDDVLVAEIANAGLERLRPLIEDALRASAAGSFALSGAQDDTAPPSVILRREDAEGSRDDTTPGPVRGIYFKNDLPSRKIEQLSTESEWRGEGEPAATIVENGLRFRVDPDAKGGGGQKTGFFLDQRDNRRLARDLAAGRTVLNLFGYTGAFGVYAAAGGAASVRNVDISARAVELAKLNHELNALAAEFTVADAFSFVRERASAREQWDFVICDPPAFAKSRGEVERAARGYKDINLYSLRLTKPGGLLMTYSCSGHMTLDLFQKIVFSAALDAGRRVSIVRRLTAGEDHPVSLFCPEGEYLKGFLLQVH